MPRKRNPDYDRTLTARLSKGKWYASAKKLYTSQKDMKTKATDVYWGSLEKLPDGGQYSFRFHPNNAFKLLSQKERENFIYPTEWDLSEYESLIQKSEDHWQDVISAVDESLLFGDVMLMNKIAEDTKMLSHLSKVFDGNETMTSDILTLAYHMFLTKHSWNRVDRWQKIEKTPPPGDVRPLTAPYITKLTQRITEQNRSDLIRLRMRMIDNDDLVCIDSTTHSGYGGKRLCEIDFGKNKDDKQLPCTVETMAYSLNSHMPVYYQTFQGNMVDIRTTELVMNELKELGFDNKVVSCTDRGYYCDDEIQWHIKHGIGLISFAKIDSAIIRRHIPEITYTGAPYGMKVDPAEKIYCGQYDEPYDFKDVDGKKYQANLKINLYYNPNFRPPQQTELDIRIQQEREELSEYLAKQRYMPDEIVKMYKLHRIKRDKDTKEVIDYSADEAKIRRMQKGFGFFAIVTYRLDEYQPLPVLKIYALRGEQEQAFEVMKEINGMDKHNCWSEDGMFGRRFIAFIGNCLVSYARSQWRNDQELFDTFDSTSEMFDEMRPIKCIAHKGNKPRITPLVKDQVLIAEKFNLDIPDYALPVTERKERPKKSTHKIKRKKPLKGHSKY